MLNCGSAKRVPIRTGVEERMTAAECRERAAINRAKAGNPEISEKRATLLTNISRSYAALAHQLEMLAADTTEANRANKLHAPPKRSVAS
jgi:hypothetical protein